MTDPNAVLGVLDEVEGHRPGAPESSLFRRSVVPVTMDDASRSELDAWVYLYLASLDRAQPIVSGDYLEYLSAARRRRDPP